MEYTYVTDPVNEFKALALAYIQGQDLTERTPEEALDMYSDALNRIWAHYEKNN